MKEKDETVKTKIRAYLYTHQGCKTSSLLRAVKIVQSTFDRLSADMPDVYEETNGRLFLNVENV